MVGFMGCSSWRRLLVVHHFTSLEPERSDRTSHGESDMTAARGAYWILRFKGSRATAAKLKALCHAEPWRPRQKDIPLVSAALSDPYD